MISSTGAREPIFTKSQFKKVMKARRWRQLVVIDIAVPRDAEPAIRDVDECYLFDIDDLEKVVHANLSERARAADQAHKIVEHEAGQFEQWLRTQGVVPIPRAAEQEVRADLPMRRSRRRSTRSRARTTRPRSRATP